jgi:hypothetical protein
VLIAAGAVELKLIRPKIASPPPNDLMREAVKLGLDHPFPI